MCPCRRPIPPSGVLAIRPRDPKHLLSPEEVRLVESLAKQVALALEVERLQQTALDAQLTVEAERLRSTLLGSVTHDFQTPLAAIMGSASSLLNLPGRDRCGPNPGDAHQHL